MKDVLFNHQWIILVLHIVSILGCAEIANIIIKHVFKYDINPEKEISDSDMLKIESKKFFVFVLLFYGLGLVFDNFVLIQKISPKDEIKMSSSNELISNQGQFIIKCDDVSYNECVDIVKSNLDKILASQEHQIDIKKIKENL
jgi:hypothetical protein